MKNTILILLTTICFNICLGQDSFHFKKHPQGINRRPDFPKPNVPQFQGYRDLNEQVDSAWTRQFGGVGIGNVTSRRSYFTYTSDHLLATESYLDFYLESGEQYNGRQEEYLYNDLGQCTHHYTNEQDLDSGDWLRKGLEEFIWNEDSNVVEYIRSIWNEDLSEFEYIFKSTATFTSFHQTKESIGYTWEGDQWKTWNKYIYEYNNADSIQLINIYTWNEVPGDWHLNYTTENFYTNNTQLDSTIESWDMGSGLELYSRINLSYNGQSLAASDTFYFWDGSHWEPDSYSEYEYTPDGKETLWTYFEWDPDEQQFVENYYEENTYTAAGDPKRYTVADYNLDIEEWEPFWINEKFYDESVDGATIVWPASPVYEPVSFHHKPIFDVLTVLFDNNQWGFGDSVIYFYGNLISPTIPVVKLEANIYPNPACDQITLQLENLVPEATITFFDQEGKFVYQSSLSTNNPVPVSKLAPGAYVYRIHNGNEWFSGKMVKE